MAEYSRIQRNFSSGIVDEVLTGRTDTDLFNLGVKEALNLIPSSRGYIFRRPGTKNIGITERVVNNSPYCRLTAVKRGTGALLVIIKKGSIDFYAEDSQNTFSISHSDIISTTGYTSENTPTKIDIPWENEDLEALDIKEYENKLYIVHPKYRPHIVSFDPDVSWVTKYTEVENPAPYEALPTAKETETEITDIISATGFSCFPVDFVEDKFKAENDYPTAQAFKGGRWYLGGTINKPSTIWASRAPSVSGKYRFDDFTLGLAKIVRVDSTLVKETTFNSAITLPEANDSVGNIKSVSYANDVSTEDKTTVLNAPGDIKDQANLPPNVDVKLGTTYKLQGSDDFVPATSGQAVAKRETTKTTTYSLKYEIQNDDAIELTETDMYGSSIKWLLTQQRLLAGTERSIWMDSGQVATPSTFDMYQTLAISNSSVKPVQWGSYVFFVPGDKRSVKGFSYDDNSGGYTLIDISSSARALFTSDIKELALCEGQETELWVRLGDGTLLSCTISQSSFGWSKQVLGGNGRAIAIWPFHSTEGRAWLYIAVLRDNVISIESMEFQDLVTTENFRLLDGSIPLPPPDQNGMVTKKQIENAMKIKLSDNEPLYCAYGDKYTLLSFNDEGKASLETLEATDEEREKAEVGFSYTSRLVTLRQEVPTNYAETSLGMRRRAQSMIIQVYRTGTPMCGYISQGKEWKESVRLLTRDRNGYYTGVIKAPIPSSTDDDVRAVVEISEPCPMTLQAIETKWNLQEV